MSTRALWKGHLKVGDLACGVALYAGASTAERTRFHIVNKATGNRVKRQFVDEKSGKPVAADEQVKAYDTEGGDTVLIEPEDIEAVIPDSDKTLTVEAFLPCGEVDTVYFDKPYFVAPADAASTEAFALIHSGLKRKKVAAIATAVLFRRVRTVLLRPHGDGIVANTLNFDYEVRPAAEVFKSAPKPKIKREMLDLAGHIIDTMQGAFDPAAFDDRYEEALAELVKAKIEGRPVPRARKPKPGKVVDLMEALRESAKASGKPATAKSPRRKAAQNKNAA